MRSSSSKRSPSTDSAASTNVTLSTAAVFDPSAPWQLNEQVSLRDESFGALAYHHGTRRLIFLKSRELVDVVRRVGEFESADAALAASIFHYAETSVRGLKQHLRQHGVPVRL